MQHQRTKKHTVLSLEHILCNIDCFSVVIYVNLGRGEIGKVKTRRITIKIRVPNQFTC